MLLKGERSKCEKKMRKTIKGALIDEEKFDCT